MLVDFHHRLPISSVRGTGLRSSSDGQRFGVQENTKIGAYYPRYFGYYGNALTVHAHDRPGRRLFHRTHLLHHRESLYILGGLLATTPSCVRFLLRWLQDPVMRADTGRQLNHGEHRQSLAPLVLRQSR